jgi:hypothetical protein
MNINHMLAEMLTYKWYVALVFSVFFIALYAWALKRRGNKLEKFLSNFLPLALALLVSSVICILVELFLGAALLVAVIAITVLSPIFEKLLFGTALKSYLPFYLSSAVAGTLIETDWAQKGLGAYNQMTSMLVVILFGYFLFYYFALKAGNAFAALGGK